LRKLEFVLRRLLTSIFVLIGVSIITFFLARVVPSNAAALYIGPKARPEDIERVSKQLGLDRPLPVQYGMVFPLNICAIRENLLEPRSSEEREGKLSFAKANKTSRPSHLRGESFWLRLEAAL